MNNKFKSKVLLLSVASTILISENSHAQIVPVDGRTGVTTTAVPFLRISPDARSGAMGDLGIALSPDANAQYWNVGKLAMSEDLGGLSITYTPWLQDLVPDVNLIYVAGYYKVGKEKNQAISTSLRYFSLGDVGLTDMFGKSIGTSKPREMAFDLGYSIKLSDNFSLGANLRYIFSNIAAGTVDPSLAYSPGKAFATDVGLFYTKTMETGDFQSNTFSGGLVLSNMGSRISYSQTEKDFLPTTLGLGGVYTRQIDYYNKFTIGLDLQKATTPTPIEKLILDPDGNVIDSYWDRRLDMSVLDGFANSFTQAPPGYGTTISVGGEYWYQDQFAGRAGYFYEHKDNGGRQYLTVGLGVKYSVFGLNFSYLVPSGGTLARNPLSNTLRFSLTFDFNKDYIEQSKNRKRKSNNNNNNKNNNRVNPTETTK